MIAEEKAALLSLENKIAALNIDAEDRKICMECITEGKLYLEDPAIIMPEADLPALMPVPAIDAEATEEIEVEVDEQAMQEQEAQQQVAIEMETEVAQEAEVQAQQDLDKTALHPHSEEGREWSEYQIHEIWKEITKDQWDKNPFNHYLDSKIFPNIWISAHSLGYFDVREKKTEEHAQQVRDHLWLYGTQKKQTPIGSKAFVIIDPQGNFGCQLASIKEADFLFHKWMQERDVGRRWVDAPCGEKNPEVIAKMPALQQRILSWEYKENDVFKRDEVWEAKANYYKRLYKHAFYKLDLTEPYTSGKLAFVDPQYRSKLLERIALMKILFVEGSYSAEEKAIIQKWLSTSPIPLVDLEKRLSDYLNRFYPNAAATHELLSLIRQQRV